ncbi:MAG: hypothetical protein QXO57_02590 [Candidatus Aenigmatarchaeota archaeon]
MVKQQPKIIPQFPHEKIKALKLRMYGINMLLTLLIAYPSYLLLYWSRPITPIKVMSIVLIIGGTFAMTLITLALRKKIREFEKQH